MVLDWLREIRQTVHTGRVTKPWCIFRTRQRAGVPFLAPRPARRWEPRRIQRNQDPASLGKEACDLLRDLLALHVAGRDIELRAKAAGQERCKAQSLADSAQCNLLRARANREVDLVREIAFLEESRPGYELQASEQKRTQQALASELQENNRRGSELWTGLFAIAQDYMNNSLDADFLSDWCLPYNAYNSLRFCLDLHALIQSNRIKLRELKLDVITTRSRQWKIRRQIDSGPNILAEGIAKELERVRESEYERELQLREESVANLSILLDVQQSRLEELYTELMDQDLGPNIILPAVENATSDFGGDERPSEDRQASESSPRDQQQSVPPQSPLPSPDDQQRANSQASGASEPDNFGQYSPGTLLDAYIQWREELERLQQVLADARRDYRRGEADHLLTFTNSNRARWEQYVLRQLRPDIAAVRTAERRVGDLARELDAAGWEIPNTPEPAAPFQQPVGGGIRGRRSTTPSDRSRSESVLSRASGVSGRRVSPTTRRRFNRWRFQTAAAAAAGA